MKITNYNMLPNPSEVTFKGNKFIGECAFINGYNGYDKTDGDAMLCAIINNSCFTNKQLNLVKDIEGNYIHSENKRSTTIIFK